MISFLSNPFEDLIMAAAPLFDGTDIRVQFAEMEDGIGCATEVKKDNEKGVVEMYIITITPHSSIVGVCDVIVHELGHILAGFDQKHNEKWKSACDSIYEMYMSFISKVVNDNEDFEIMPIEIKDDVDEIIGRSGE